MRGVVAAILCACLAALSTQAASAARQGPAPVGAAVLRVAVSVRDGSRAVSGLTGTDFVLTDNDVPQKVEALSADRLPLDMTLIVDSKGSTTNLADRFVKDVQVIARVLRPSDRLRVLRADTFAEELRPMSSVTGQLTIAPWQQIGWSSLHDAIVAALMWRADAGRHHVVVAVTDGEDTMSVTTAERVREVATRSDALLQVVSVRSAGGAGAATASLRPRFRDDSVLVLAEAAEQTGGELRGPGLFGDSDLASAVTRVINEFRQSYVLLYTPTSVESDGWHELSVAVPRAPNATVRARRGYAD